MTQMPPIDCIRFGKANGRNGKAASNAVATITPLQSDNRPLIAGKGGDP